MPKFKRTEIVQFPKRTVDLTEGNSWARLDHPTTIQEYGAINRIDIACDPPHLVAITSYAKVQIYNAEINEVYKTLSKFQDAAFGGRFRRDGQLLAVGTSEGQVKIFDVATKTQLRTLQGHTTATRRVDFTLDGTHVVTFSDDKTVGLWDLAAETRIESFGEHADYVRAGCVSTVNSDIVVSGTSFVPCIAVLIFISYDA
jgi:U3 small nucleolar RNA-associated protein 15